MITIIELFQSRNTTQSPKSTTGFGKRMFRNPDDAIVAGVASGIAAYFGLDSVWVRLGFVLLTLGSGFGVLLYIVLWIILPEAKTETEKMQMRGEPINLKNVETTIKERAEEFKKKDKSKIKSILAAPVYALGAILRAIGLLFKKLIPLVFRVIGALVSIAAAFGLAFLLFVVLNVIFNANSPYIDFPLSQLAQGGIFYGALIAAFFTAFVPLIVIVLLGASLLMLKNTFSRYTVLSLAVLWSPIKE
jgi:phage shock protein PspC (stress-responsive transcriptional regulator)